MAYKLKEQTDLQYPITLYRGITYSRSFTYEDENEAPINLTGKIVVVKFKSVFTNLLTLDSSEAPTTLGSSVVITDAPAGKFTFTLTDEETLTAKDNGRWWMELRSGGAADLLWRDEVIVLDP